MTFSNLKEYVKYNLGCLKLLDDSDLKEMTLHDQVNYVYEYARETAEKQNGKHFNWRFYGKENILKEIERQLVSA